MLSGCLDKLFQLNLFTLIYRLKWYRDFKDVSIFMQIASQFDTMLVKPQGEPGLNVLQIYVTDKPRAYFYSPTQWHIHVH